MLLARLPAGAAACRAACRRLVNPPWVAPLLARRAAPASIVDAVSAQMKEAMKAKDTTRLAALRNMRAAFLVAIKETGTETLPDDKAVETLRKLVKQRADSIAQYSAGGRPELVAAEEAEMKLIESFLPALADAATTEKWVREAIAALGATKPGDAGKVMGAVIKAHKGEVDNAVAKRLAEQILGGK